MLFSSTSPSNIYSTSDEPQTAFWMPTSEGIKKQEKLPAKYTHCIFNENSLPCFQKVFQQGHSFSSVRDAILCLLWHLGICLCKSIRLKTGVPAKVCRSSRGHNGSIASSWKQLHRSLWFTRAETKHTKSIGRLVFKPDKHLVQTWSIRWATTNVTISITQYKDMKV